MLLISKYKIEKIKKFISYLKLFYFSKKIKLFNHFFFPFQMSLFIFQMSRPIDIIKLAIKETKKYVLVAKIIIFLKLPSISLKLP
jgi:hypothetical protein